MQVVPRYVTCEVQDVVLTDIEANPDESSDHDKEDGREEPQATCKICEELSLLDDLIRAA